ncbi:hypothetical protein EZV62_003975 [Acer yangbiense]|uniref:D-isomer specific 2-hydroxyacid dehydrogenase NAD-binding domain-containing protein n=1 Tax=Acer yangbiense TaxID=1000413 RepID=A0A5C7IID7_9ROSI|nr:hypothetical protein EZV62_003975 [Acer yangbiense]
MGPKGVLISIGRGPHVDEHELVPALVEGHLGGAGLDVFENEPKVPEELVGLENVVLTPHVGSGKVETRTAMADLVFGNLEAHFLSKPLLTETSYVLLWHTLYVGLDKIDLPKCIEKGIIVTNTPDVLTDEVADLAIGLILAVLRRLCDCDRHVKSGKWKEGDYQLTTKAVAIVED